MCVGEGGTDLPGSVVAKVCCSVRPPALTCSPPVRVDLLLPPPGTHAPVYSLVPDCPVTLTLVLSPTCGSVICLLLYFLTPGLTFYLHLSSTYLFTFYLLP